MPGVYSWVPGIQGAVTLLTPLAGRRDTRTVLTWWWCSERCVYRAAQDVANPKYKMLRSYHRRATSWAVTAWAKRWARRCTVQWAHGWIINGMCAWSILRASRLYGCQECIAGGPHLVEFLVFNSAFGRHRHWLRQKDKKKKSATSYITTL